MDEYLLTDWRALMAGIRYWLAGGNPYGPYPGLAGELYPPGFYPYPPPTLVLGTPLALLPWQLSGLILTLASVVGLERWARQTSGRSALPWMLLWLPVLQGLVIGQTTLLALVGLLFAELAYRRSRDWRAGLLLALAVLKPQAVILPAAWLLFRAARERRWGLPLAFLVVSTTIWVAALVAAGPGILPRWVDGLRAYDDNLPNRPLIFPPLGPLLALLAGVLWWRRGRRDALGALLLLNTLLYPLSVIYVAVGVAVVVLRWRDDWPLYPLALSWLLAAVLTPAVRTPDSIALLTQAIVATGLLAGLLPRLPWPARLRLRSPARESR